MLPSLSRKLAPLVAATALALSPGAPALALGKTERNILKGLAAAVIVQQMIHYANRSAAEPAYQSTPAYRPPAYQPPPPSYPREAYPPTAYPPAEPQHTSGRVIGRDAPPPRVEISAAETVFRDYGPQGRREIQRRLAAYGYYQGNIDGIWGRGTANAVERYARDIRAGDQLRHQRGALELYQGLLG